LQQECMRLGLVWAGYTDGGGSSDLSVRGGPRYGHRERRPVGSWVAILAQTPAASAGDYASTHPLAVGAAVIAVGAGAWLLYHAKHS
jgi:hypothetical protein